MGDEDFIRKPFSPRRLIERVQAVLRCWIPKDRDQGCRRQGDRAWLAPHGSRAYNSTWQHAPVTLAVTEFLILQAPASRPGIVKSRSTLMDVACDDQIYVDDRTSTVSKTSLKSQAYRRRI
jgi:two-component system response regulator ChvI